MQIKLLVACREKDQARAVCANLVQAAGGSLAGEATDIAGALHRAADTTPDVLLLEHTRREEESAWNVLSQLGGASGSTRALLLCDAYTHQMVIAFIQRGASGCLLKSSAPSLHAKAVVAVHQGEPWFGRTALLQALRSQIAERSAAPTLLPADHDLLTAREREILGLIGNALSNKEIARQLAISDMTVKTHLHRIYVKLNKSGRYKAFLSNAGLSLH